jgi:ubiquinone biosynthesis monooxygenase Coq7
MPGDASPEKALEEMIRVNHAGEYGAVRIYQGQLAVLGKTASAPLIQEMALQEQEHLQEFERQLVARRIRPTLLTPLWHVAGFALGAATALLGEKAAMACTVAVEEVINDHYLEQKEQLPDTEADLKEKIETNRITSCKKFIKIILDTK